MKIIDVRNVNYALPEGARWVYYCGEQVSPHGQATLEAPGPVATVYRRPQERVLFEPCRDANPFFHLFESLWILAGRKDVEFLAQFNKRMRDYSDDGVTFHAPYGHRLRVHFGIDQVQRAIDLLKQDPDSRQVVLQIWSVTDDLGTSSKDIPCNDLVAVKVRNGELRITVFCRSNDLVWGAYGANAVQFSMLQEYLASSLGVAMGAYTQISDSFHAYIERDDWVRVKLLAAPRCPYTSGDVAAWPLIDVPSAFDQELGWFLSDPLDELGDMFPKRDNRRNSFFWKVAEPMYAAWHRHKQSKNGAALLGVINEADRKAGAKPIDWLVAGEQWLARREAPVPESAARVVAG